MAKIRSTTTPTITPTITNIDWRTIESNNVMLLALPATFTSSFRTRASSSRVSSRTRPNRASTSFTSRSIRASMRARPLMALPSSLMSFRITFSASATSLRSSDSPARIASTWSCDINSFLCR